MFVSLFELLEILFKQQCNAHIISAQTLLELDTMSSKDCCCIMCPVEELSVIFELGSSAELGELLFAAAEDLKKQEKLLATETCFFPFS